MVGTGLAELWSRLMPSLKKKLSALVVRRHSLSGWSGLHEPKTEGKDWGVTLPSRFLATLFDRALPDVAHNEWKDTKNGSVATYLRGATDEQVDRVRDFLDTFAIAIAIEDLTEGSFALSRNFERVGDDWKRTVIGQLVHDAKPYDATPTREHRAAAKKLAAKMAAFIEACGCLRGVDSVVAVPPSDATRVYALPRILAAAIASKCDLQDLSSAVTKLRVTEQLKNLSKAEKADELVGSIEIASDDVDGRRILVIDDLYQSGTTLNFVGLELLGAGAAEVHGLAATKTMRDTDNVAVADDDGGVDDDDDSE